MTRHPRASAETVAFTDRHIAVYVGRDTIGEVLGRTIRTVDSDGNELLGVFRNRESAKRTAGQP